MVVGKMVVRMKNKNEGTGNKFKGKYQEKTENYIKNRVKRLKILVGGINSIYLPN